MLLMPQPASAAASVRTAPSATMRRKPWPSMGIAPRSPRGTPLSYSHGAACGDRFVAAKGGVPPFLPPPIWRQNVPLHSPTPAKTSCLQHRLEFRKRAQGEGAHVVSPISIAGPQRENPLHGAGDGNAGVTCRVAVAVAGRSGGARLSQTPGRTMPLAHGSGDQGSIGLARRADACHCLIADAQQRDTRAARVQHSPTEEIGRGTGYGEERSANQPAGGGFPDRNSFAALLQALGDFGGKLGHGIHCCVLRLGQHGRGPRFARYTSSSSLT